jgi:hypothetical protein
VGRDRAGRVRCCGCSDAGERQMTNEHATGSLPLAPQVHPAEQKAAKRAALTALRDALAKATGPDRELDFALCNAPLEVCIARAGRQRRLYTASIDAAVGLVPEGAWRETNGVRRSINIPSPVPKSLAHRNHGVGPDERRARLGRHRAAVHLRRPPEVRDRRPCRGGIDDQRASCHWLAP